MGANRTVPELELIIYDLDGTLVDSRKDLAESINEMLRRLSLAELEEDTIADFVGRGVKNLVTSSLTESLSRNGNRAGTDSPCGVASDPESSLRADSLLGTALPLLREIYAQHLLVHTRLYPGVTETLSHFSNRTQAVCSNKPQSFSQEILDGLGVGSYFARVLGGDSLTKQKPHPDPLLALMSEFRAAPSATLMVGDGLTDIEAGKAAGVITCAVTSGFRPKAELLAARPDYVIENLFELAAIFPS